MEKAHIDGYMSQDMLEEPKKCASSRMLVTVLTQTRRMRH